VDGQYKAALACKNRFSNGQMQGHNVLPWRRRHLLNSVNNRCAVPVKPLISACLLFLGMGILGCINTEKRPIEDTFLHNPSVPADASHGIAQQIGREMMTQKTIDCVIVQNKCLNTLIPSRYELIVEELNDSSPAKAVLSRKLEKFEFSFPLSVYSDYRYLVKLVEFNSQRVIAEKKITKGSNKIILTPLCKVGE